MTRRYYSSTAQRTTLANSLTSGATTLIVASVAGFPGTRPYTLILDMDTINEEVVTVTAASGVTLTVIRGEDGTTAVAHDLGATAVHGFTGRDLGEPQAHMDTSDGVHGVTGDVVGTEGSQTLIGKSMDGLENTFTNLPQSSVTDLSAALALKAPLASPTFTGSPVLPSTTVVGDVDAAELQRLNGVTANVQTQLDAKAPYASPTFTGAVSLPSTTGIGSVTGTEIGYLAGATSNIQSQIDAFAVESVVPAGGATDEILVKLSGADYDMAWKPLSYLAYVPGTGGDYVVTDGAITGGDSTGTYTSGTFTYRWHKFTTTGATLQLSVSEAVIGDILIVGGGGGGANGSLSDRGGGGGAGAYYESAYAFGTGLHNCTVGAGGAVATAGDETRFDDVIAYGGGRGGAAGAGTGGNGGSGGGGGSFGGGGGTATGGSLDGGSTDTTVVFRVANGGGAGSSSASGGGAAWSSSITGAAVTYATGGAGRSSAIAGTAGAANTGNGGGGGGNSNNVGAAGGSGIVIVRYRIA